MIRHRLIRDTLAWHRVCRSVRVLAPENRNNLHQRSILQYSDHYFPYCKIMLYFVSLVPSCDDHAKVPSFYIYIWFDFYDDLMIN